jgi:hypothetical protein
MAIRKEDVTNVPNFIEDIHTAFDLSSGGMGVHVFAVNNLYEGKVLHDWEQGSLDQFSCNYLIQPYILGWISDEEIAKELFPNKPSPNTDLHKKLWKVTSEEYKNLDLKNPSKQKQAAIHKLGCMLAVTDQILYDAFSSGQPIPANYRPVSEKHIENWKKMFGKEMPNIEGLYLDAYKVFKSHAESSDPVVSHLLKMPNLSYFTR